MNDRKTSRRRFVQLAGGLGLCGRHGLLPAQPAQPARVPSRSLATLSDGAICLEWDVNLHCRVSRFVGTRRRAITSWSPSDYVLREDGRHVAHFTHRRDARVAVEDANGPGKRITLSGLSADGMEKTVTATLYERHPGFAVVRVVYRNTTSMVVSVAGWTCGDFLVPAGGTAQPHFWSYSGASYEDRRDWLQPVTPGFAQDNFLGMEASDYGGGTPIVDVWQREGGLAVGHVESAPAILSLPVQERSGAVRLAVCSRQKHEVGPGKAFETLDTFVAVHGGDHFATLAMYRRFMAERGLRPALPKAAAYEPIWCAWGYERDCTTALIEGTLPKVKELGLDWAVIDDGWQAMIGDWRPHPTKYPNGDADVRRLVSSIRATGLKARLWYSPLSVAPGADLLHDHADMLLLDKHGAVQNISWWNSFYLCPAYAPTLAHTQALIQKFIGDWGFSGLKIDGQHLNGVPPCFNPAHGHARPEESVEGLQQLYRTIYEAATALDENAVVEVCPCGTSYSAFNFPYMNQAPASDPESSWQVRLKGKSLKALMGANAPFAGDHVELSDGQDDFASTVGMGGVVSTKFTWPVDPKPKDSFLLTPEKEVLWRHWIALYRDRMLPLGTYRGELYDIAFDRPETHVIEKSGTLYYAFYAERWRGAVTLRGLQAGAYRVRDYFNDRELGTASGAAPRLKVAFERFLLLEAKPA